MKNELILLKAIYFNQQKSVREVVLGLKEIPGKEVIRILSKWKQIGLYTNETYSIDEGKLTLDGLSYAECMFGKIEKTAKHTFLSRLKKLIKII